ncbi:restriction endonuclease subunit S [Streptococcus suis]|uniref:restriction endonuclease subunit S n=1 Tax=Streptococcus suis TaxID=1307 RepID=UPI001582E437|nr:restriction endonuclease subunit S [Streptococcus suis]
MTKKLPHYRFQGYTDAWELRKLGEEIRFYNGRAYKQSELLDVGKYKVVRVGNFNTNEKWYYSNLELEDSKTIDTGDLVYLWATSFGPEIWEGTKSIYHYHIWKLIINQVEKIDKSYLYTWLYQDKEKIAQNTNGSTMVHITKEMIENRDFEFPSLPEQEAIGTFFSTLDQQITLHQRKLDTLKEQKKTYLKLLFPAKGQTKPALRFQGFEDDWEEVKLGEVLVEYNKKSEIENQFELLSSTNSGIEPRSGRVSGESNIGYKIIKRGMVVLSPQNLWLGNINYNAKFEIGIVSPSYKVFNINGPNELYLATVLRLPKMFFEYAQASVQGASIVRRNLDLDLFSSILVQLPSLPEQKAIGTFFQTLDQEIAQVEDKLASLKEMKKTLLRKLFV